MYKTEDSDMENLCGSFASYLLGGNDFDRFIKEVVAFWLNYRVSK